MFIGTAGSGKTCLAAAFGEWLEREMEAKIAYVNLDPGCLNTPYKPDFDIRSLFTVCELMERENLGPNGAMIRAAELMEESVNDIVDKIAQLEADLKLIDTPGQMEIFVFRSAGPKIAEALRSKDVTVTVYLIDPLLAKTPTGLAVAVSLSIATQLRLGTPTFPILNKVDLVKEEEIDRLLMDFDYLRDKIVEEQSGAIIDLALRYVDTIEILSSAVRLVKVSAKTGEGMDQLYDIVRESICVCGDLT
jgi:hypothetical protein